MGKEDGGRREWAPQGEYAQRIIYACMKISLTLLCVQWVYTVNFCNGQQQQCCPHVMLKHGKRTGPEAQWDPSSSLISSTEIFQHAKALASKCPLSHPADSTCLLRCACDHTCAHQINNAIEFLNIKAAGKCGHKPPTHLVPRPPFTLKFCLSCLKPQQPTCKGVGSQSCMLPGFSLRTEDRSLSIKEQVLRKSQWVSCDHTGGIQHLFW